MVGFRFLSRFFLALNTKKVSTSFKFVFFLSILTATHSLMAATVKVEGTIPLAKPTSEIQLDITVSNIEIKDRIADYRDLQSYLEVIVKGNAASYNEADALSSLNKYLLTFIENIEDNTPNNFSVKIKVKLSKLSGTIEDDLESGSLRVKVKYKKDSESPETSITRNNLVFIAAPAFSPSQPIIGSHKQLTVNIQAVNTVPTSLGQGRTPLAIYAYAFKVEEGPQEFTLPARIFEPNNDNPKQVSCKLTKPSGNVGDCLSCAESNADKSNVYLDHAQIAASSIPNFYINRSTVTAGKEAAVIIPGLENQKTYFVFLVYDQGTQSSQCLLGQPSINYTLTELNGEEEATIVDLRCFIASAAYGSPLAKEVKVFRWYRDHVLAKHAFGRFFIELYYKFSPYLATVVHNHPMAKEMSQKILDLVAKDIKSQMITSENHNTEERWLELTQ